MDHENFYRPIVLGSQPGRLERLFNRVLDRAEGFLNVASIAVIVASILYFVGHIAVYLLTHGL